MELVGDLTIYLTKYINLHVKAIYKKVNRLMQEFTWLYTCNANQVVPENDSAPSMEHNIKYPSYTAIMWNKSRLEGQNWRKGYCTTHITQTRLVYIPYYSYQGALYRLPIINVQIIPVTFSCKLFKIQMNSAVWPVMMKMQETLWNNNIIVKYCKYSTSKISKHVQSYMNSVQWRMKNGSKWSKHCDPHVKWLYCETNDLQGVLLNNYIRSSEFLWNQRPNQLSPQIVHH